MIDLYSEVTQRPRGSVEARMYALRDSGIVPKGQRGRGKQPEFGIEELLKLTFANVANEVRQADKEVQNIAGMRPMIVKWDASSAWLDPDRRELKGDPLSYDDFVKSYSRLNWEYGCLPAPLDLATRWPKFNPLDCLKEIIRAKDEVTLRSVSHQDIGYVSNVDISFSTIVRLSQIPFLSKPFFQAGDDLVSVVIDITFGSIDQLDAKCDLHERKTSLDGSLVMLMADAVLEEERET